MFTLSDLIAIAVQMEKNGEALYRRSRVHAGNEDLAALLEWMAGEERRHAEWLRDLQQKELAGADDAIAVDMRRALVDDFVDGQTFSLQDVDFAAVRSVGEMIDIFIEFENDTLRFYDLLRTFLDNGPASLQLDTIMTEEKKHIEELSRMAAAKRTPPG